MEQMAWTDDRLEERFDGIDRRFDEIDGKFIEVDRRFDEIDGKFIEVDRRFDEIDRRFDEVYRRFGLMDKRFDRLEDVVADLQGAMLELHRTLSRGAVGVIVALFGLIITLLAKGG
jgi:predicted nuclease with TOPRIM domain